MCAISIRSVDTTSGHSAGPDGAPGSRSLVTRLACSTARLASALRVRRERRLLLQLDEHMLKDLGLSAADAYAEANRSFWDVPSGCMDGSRGFSSNFVAR